MGERCTVEGAVQNIIFQNEENGYTVLCLVTDEGEAVTVVGCIPCAAAGERMTVTGAWVNHPSYGTQLTAESVERRMPEGEDEIAAYLASGIIKGVGPATAARLVERFGEDTLRVIEDEPERMRTVKGITAKKAMEISQAFRALTGLRRVMEFLARYDLPVHLAMQLYRVYGADALPTVKDNPYLLSGERYGVAFSTMDAIAISMTAIRRNFDVAMDAEITFEANPDSVTDKLLHRMRAEGFNRVSLGIQDDHDDMLKKLGRPHTYAQAVAAFQRIRKAGFRNVSLDLMYGLPGQTLQDWQETLANVLRMNPEHFSCYGLKIEEGTPFYEMKDMLNLPDDDTQADMYLAAVEMLRDRGFRQYEVSNFARKGLYSRHNFKYWTGGEYLGFGPSASSDFAGKRFTLVADLQGST